MSRVFVITTLGFTALLAVATHTVGQDPREAKPAAAQGLPPEEALKKARANGKYALLLRQVKAPQDRETYKDFHDEGFLDDPEWAGQKDMPAGYYVYVFPYWYVWRDEVARAAKQKRGYGPEQATGEPDTEDAGDRQSAWASKSQDDRDEWLLLEYAEIVTPKTVMVYENYNPGALVKVTAFTLEGKEVELWSGKDPAPTADGKGVAAVAAKEKVRTNRVKLYLNSKEVPGWNEIDAVGILDETKKIHWAVAAEASTTYAADAREGPDRTEERVRRLERELRQLKRELAELKKQKEKK